MQKKSRSPRGLSGLRTRLGVALCSVGFLLGIMSFAATLPQAVRKVAVNSTDSIHSGSNKRLGTRTAMKLGGSQSPAPAGWSLVSSPNNSTLLENQLFGVTCASASDCWAIGVDNASQTFIEQWNGDMWSIVSSPNTSATQRNFFYGVTCASTSECWAVGYYDNGQGSVAQTLIEEWNGTSWSIIASANTSTTQFNYLNAVTCASTSDCWAVGYYGYGGLGTLTEHWDGISWSIVTSPNPSTFENSLTGVTCASSSNCWAVGSDDFNNQTLIEQWNGTSWSVITSPNPSGSSFNQLNAVACGSASQCWAVGYAQSTSGFDQTLIERWNGTSWSIVRSPNASTNNNVLNSVTCTSTSQCWAVGYYASPSDQTLVEELNGTTWSIVGSPNNGAIGNELYGVTCTSVSECWAVGFYINPVADEDQTLIEHWNGTSWTIAASPNPAGPNFLLGVTCATDSQCWAVGYDDAPDGSGLFTLIEQWNGTSWAIVASPNTATVNALANVTCTSTSDCWAVGNYFTSDIQPLIEHWDGTSWTITASPSGNGPLSSVTCTSPSQCWAVGYVNGRYRQTLIEQWDGNAWTIVSSPNTSTMQTNYLNAVTCTSASECWAVGYYNNGTADQTLIEEWDGTVWAIVSSPSGSTTQMNHLNGVACASASICWAVGYYVNDNGVQQVLIELWDGSSWTIAASPPISTTQNNYFDSVTCASSSDCWAVGLSNNGQNQTLIEQWNGASWSNVTSPDSDPAQDNRLVSVTCVSPSECWAVGFYYSDSDYGQTLIAEYTASPLQITSVSGPSNGPFVIMGQSPPLISIDIQSSPDLVTPFASFATVTADANGLFEYDDASAVMAPQRFYQASYR